MTPLPTEPSEVIRHEARQTRLVIILCTAILSCVLLGLALATYVLFAPPVSAPPSDEPIVTPWMSFKDYQVEFKRQRANRFYPAWKEGRVKNGRSEYRAVFTDSQQLPTRIATHFDGNGAPNGWSETKSFMLIVLATGFGVPLFTMGIAYSIRFFPADFLNVPNSTYWRKPESYLKAYQFLFTSSFWFASAFLLWQTALSRLVVSANRLSPPWLDNGKVMLLTIPLLAFVFLWVVALVVWFLRTDHKSLHP